VKSIIYRKLNKAFEHGNNVYINLYRLPYIDTVVEILSEYANEHSESILLQPEIHNVDNMKDYLINRPVMNIFFDSKLGSMASRNETTRILWGLGKSTGNIGFILEEIYGNTLDLLDDLQKITIEVRQE
jgi:hypothetical protein